MMKSDNKTYKRTYIHHVYKEHVQVSNKKASSLILNFLGGTPFVRSYDVHMQYNNAIVKPDKL